LQLRQLIEILGCKVVAGEGNVTQEVDEVFAADMMSDVLAFTRPGAVLLTGLTNVQSVITAHVAEAKAVIYVRGKRPDADAIKLAEQKGIPLLVCPLPMFTTCGLLFESGLRTDSGTETR
jgi:predicted transcriptional regulator